MQRRRQIEAINGAWAMIGLTAGLVIEGQTGKGILAQVTSYFLLCLWHLYICSLCLDRLLTTKFIRLEGSHHFSFE